jgi:hypothetical protein
MDGQQDSQQQYVPPQGGYPPQGPYPPQTAPQQAAPKKKHPVRRWLVSVGTIVVALVLASIIIGALQNHHSGAGTCTSNSCIVSDLQTSLVGVVDKGDSVMTKVSCQPATVKDQGNGTWTAGCTVTYSNGTTAAGTGTLDNSQDEVTFVPSGL